MEKALPQAEKSPRRRDLLNDKADALYDLASAALSTGDYKNAFRQAASFAKAFPKHELTPEVKFIGAEALLLSGKQAEADAAYGELLKDYPNHADADQWLVRRALARYLQKQYSDVVALLKPQAAKLNQADRKAEALFLLGSSQLELKQYRRRGGFAESVACSPAEKSDRRRNPVRVGQRPARGWRGQRREGNAQAPVRPTMATASWPIVSISGWPNGRSTRGHSMRRRPTTNGWSIMRRKARSLRGRWSDWVGRRSINRISPRRQNHFPPCWRNMPGQPVAVRARYGCATARQQLKDFARRAEDAEAFLKADPKSPDRNDVRYLLGLAQEGLKKNPEAAATFESLLADDPKYAGRRQGAIRVGLGPQDGRPRRRGRRSVRPLAREHGDSPLAAESWFNVGEYQYHQKKDYLAAAAAYSSAVAKAGKSELGEKAAHKLGWAWFQAQDYPQAEQAFSSEVSNFPGGALSPDARFMAGESLFKQNKYETALAALQKAAGEKLSSPDFAALALLHAAQSAGQMQIWNSSLELLAQLQHDFPKSPHLVQAAYEEGWAKQNLNQLGEALKLYESVADKTDAVVGARARFMMGEVLFAQGNHKEAIRNFLKVVYGYGDTKAPAPYKLWQANATYEAARCFEVMKSVDQAKKLYGELVAKYPDSDKLAAAKKRLSELGR